MLAYISKFVDKVKEYNKKKEIERENRRQQEFSAKYYDFWNYRGRVYGASKFQKRFGDTLVTYTEFFISRSSGPDEQVSLHGYDLPIANGQEVMVVYGGSALENGGQIVLYINLALGKKLDFKKILQE